MLFASQYQLILLDRIFTVQFFLLQKIIFCMCVCVCVCVNNDYSAEKLREAILSQNSRTLRNFYVASNLLLTGLDRLTAASMS